MQVLAQALASMPENDRTLTLMRFIVLWQALTGRLLSSTMSHIRLDRFNWLDPMDCRLRSQPHRLGADGRAGCLHRK